MSEAPHSVRFPGETDDYRRARNALLEAEIELRRQIEAVAAQRRTLPLGGEVQTDYRFEEWDPETNGPRTVALPELFADGKDSLFLYSFMFIPAGDDPLGVACPSCTSIIDAIDGAAQHITQRMNFAVVAKAPIAQFREHARNRGWRHARLLSSANGTIHHFWSSELFFVPTDPGEHPRHVDFMWPIWSVFDRTPEGRGSDWNPRLEYS